MRIRTPSVVLETVLDVRGPGFGSLAEQKRKLVPTRSVSSTRTMSENDAHSAWKYLRPSSGTSVVVFSPGSTMAGAEGSGGGEGGERVGGGWWECGGSGGREGGGGGGGGGGGSVVGGWWEGGGRVWGECGGVWGSVEGVWGECGECGGSVGGGWWPWERGEVGRVVGVWWECGGKVREDGGRVVAMGQWGRWEGREWRVREQR